MCVCKNKEKSWKQFITFFFARFFVFRDYITQIIIIIKTTKGILWSLILFFFPSAFCIFAHPSCCWCFIFKSVSHGKLALAALCLKLSQVTLIAKKKIMKNVHFTYTQPCRKLPKKKRIRKNFKVIIQFIFATGNIWNTLNKIKRAIVSVRCWGSTEQGWVQNTLAWKLLSMISCSLLHRCGADAAPKRALRMAKTTTTTKKEMQRAEKISWEFSWLSNEFIN